MNIIVFLISFGFLIMAMTVHEFSHALVANKLGDSTARYSGRLTLNPLAHIDLIGTFLLPLFLFITTRGEFVFGAARPVPINYWALKNPKKDILWIGLSGPAANFIFAFCLSFLWRVFPSNLIINFIFKNLIFINVVLGVFNLLPIPPLDGSRILMGLLPPRLVGQYVRIEPYGFMLVILLLGLGVFDAIIWPVVRLILNILC